MIVVKGQVFLSFRELEEKYHQEIGGTETETTMAGSAQEDIYSLEKAKELFDGLYDRRVRESQDLSRDKYAYHLGEIERHIRDAISERQAEGAAETKMEMRPEQRGHVSILNSWVGIMECWDRNPYIMHDPRG